MQQIMATVAQLGRDTALASCVSWSSKAASAGSRRCCTCAGIGSRALEQPRPHA